VKAERKSSPWAGNSPGKPPEPLTKCRCEEEDKGAEDFKEKGQ
jgi:hypothetical protein